MEKQMIIKVNGKSLPCFPTMGAMLRFREETGREVTEIKGHEVSALCTYLWCTVKSACARTGKEFDMGVQEFCDNVDPKTLNEWQKSMESLENEDEDSEKKSHAQ